MFNSANKAYRKLNVTMKNVNKFDLKQRQRVSIFVGLS